MTRFVFEHGGSIHRAMYLFLGAAALLAFARAVAPRPRRWRVGPFRAAVVSTLVFWLAHYSWVVHSCFGYGHGNAQCTPAYAGLRAFTWLAPLTAAGALVVAWRWAESVPRRAALVPLALGFYWVPCYFLLGWGAPPETYVQDLREAIWLVIESVAATAFLRAYAALDGRGVAAARR